MWRLSSAAASPNRFVLCHRADVLLLCLSHLLVWQRRKQADEAETQLDEVLEARIRSIVRDRYDKKTQSEGGMEGGLVEESKTKTLQMAIHLVFLPFGELFCFVSFQCLLFFPFGIHCVHYHHHDFYLFFFFAPAGL